MKTVTTCTNVYEFKELSEAAKKKAVEDAKQSDIDVSFELLENDLMEMIHEDYGIKNARFGYSLSFSQGDGLHFDCDDFLTPKIKKMAAGRLTDEENAIINAINYLTAKTESSVHMYEYAHKNDLILEYEDESASPVMDKYESILQDIYLNICKECEKQGYSIYDETDEEAIETIEANEWHYLEDGSLTSL